MLPGYGLGCEIHVNWLFEPIYFVNLCAAIVYVIGHGQYSSYASVINIQDSVFLLI